MWSPPLAGVRTGGPWHTSIVYVTLLLIVIGVFAFLAVLLRVR
jgi:hypothetical protein